MSKAESSGEELPGGRSVDVPRGPIYRFAARARDLLLAGAALLVASPVILLFCALSRRSTGASALFRQTRLGMGGSSFVVLKIRTLRPEAPSDAHRTETEHLATPVGRLMRRTKIDELPQLWNVVKGDMSLVGPRPIIPEEYTGAHQRIRLAVRPGVTGLWQLSRVRERPFHENPEYDLFYLANRSFMLDAWLIWRTALLLALGKETKIRLAARLWERNVTWRKLVPERSRAIPQPSGPPRSRFAYGLTLAAACLLVAPGLVAALLARSDLLAAQSAMIQARTSARALDTGQTQQLLDEAAGRLEQAEGKLASFVTVPLRIVPGLGNNLAVPAALTQAGKDLVAAGRSGLQVLEDLPLDEGGGEPLLQDRQLNLQPFLDAAAPARELGRHIAAAEQKVASSPQLMLLPPVADARAQVMSILDDAAGQAGAAAGAAEVLPALFGQSGRRTWVLGAENTAELRGRGGYLGSFGLLTTEDGRISLGDFRGTSGLPRLPAVPDEVDAPPEYVRQYLPLGGLSVWQNLLMSPHFPTGAQLLLDNLREHAGIPAGGVISLDPTALSYLLQVTGPVEIPDIPEPITSENVVDWTLNRLYLLYEDETDQRKEQLSVIAGTVWDRLLNDPALPVKGVIDALSRAAAERHLVVYSSQPEEQALLEELGIAGAVEQDTQDYLMLVGQNFGENKMDYYVSRDISYSAVIDESGSAAVETTVTVTNNAAADAPIPVYVGGRPRPDRPPGTARTFLTLFVPGAAELQDVLRDGQPITDFDNTAELGKRRLGVIAALPPGESEQITFRYRVPGALEDGRYELTVQKQATVRPDTLHVQIQLPPDLQVEQARGFDDDLLLTFDGELRSDRKLSAEFASPLTDRVLAWFNSVMRRPVAAVSDG